MQTARLKNQGTGRAGLQKQVGYGARYWGTFSGVFAAAITGFSFEGTAYFNGPLWFSVMINWCTILYPLVDILARGALNTGSPCSLEGLVNLEYSFVSSGWNRSSLLRRFESRVAEYGIPAGRTCGGFALPARWPVLVAVCQPSS